MKNVFVIHLELIDFKKFSHYLSLPILSYVSKKLQRIPGQRTRITGELPLLKSTSQRPLHNRTQPNRQTVDISPIFRDDSYFVHDFDQEREITTNVVILNERFQ